MEHPQPLRGGLEGVLFLSDVARVAFPGNLSGIKQPVPDVWKSPCSVHVISMLTPCLVSSSGANQLYTPCISCQVSTAGLCVTLFPASNCNKPVYLAPDKITTQFYVNTGATAAF